MIQLLRKLWALIRRLAGRPANPPPPPVKAGPPPVDPP